MKFRLIIVGVIGAILVSCTKKHDSSPAPVYNQSFKWTYVSTDYVADSSTVYINGRFNKRTILAWNKGNVVGSFKIGFLVTSFDLGAYQFTPTTTGNNPSPPSATTNNLYYYDDNGNELRVINGAVNILSKTNERMSGNFTANLLDGNGVNKYLVGSFTDVPIKP
jgi:hypothetical protein